MKFSRTETNATNTTTMTTNTSTSSRTSSSSSISCVHILCCEADHHLMPTVKQVRSFSPSIPPQHSASPLPAVQCKTQFRTTPH